jgi:hypothetical protein
MRTVGSVVLVAMSATMVLAQPVPPPQGSPQQGYPPPQGQLVYPPPQPVYGPQGDPSQGYVQPAPYGYGQAQMQVQLTVDEQWLLSRGYISDGQHIAGGIGALFFGFGVGQMIQGRWSEKGWIFTIGESVAFGAMMYGIFAAIDDCFDYESSCNNDDRYAGMIIMGALGFGVLRIWETVDAFVAPASHNEQVRALHLRLGMPVASRRLMPFVAPRGDDGGIAGVGFRF